MSVFALIGNASESCSTARWRDLVWFLACWKRQLADMRTHINLGVEQRTDLQLGRVTRAASMRSRQFNVQTGRNLSARPKKAHDLEEAVCSIGNAAAAGSTDIIVKASANRTKKGVPKKERRATARYQRWYSASFPVPVGVL